MTPLIQAYNRGVQAARLKLALQPPTPVDAFMAAVETGKDVPVVNHVDAAPQPALEGATAPTPPNMGGLGE